MKENYRFRLLKQGLAMLLILMYTDTRSQIIEWDNCSKFLGNISQYSNSSDWPDYWNQVTPENGGKWGSVEGTRDEMNWTYLDLAYDLAKDNDLIFKQHVFVWGSQQPGWIESLTPEEQLEEIEEWIMAYCERYPDTDIIEVVNEPLHAAPFGTGKGNYANALGGSGNTGWDWIIKAFELAKEHCPNAALMINEYGLLNNASARRNYLEIVNLLKERELIDGVGAQGHAFTVNNMTADDMTDALDHLAEAGLPLFITELDVDGPTDDTQLTRYQEIFPAIWEHPSVAGVTLWGYKEGTMWTEEAYLLNSDRSNRPAFDWMLEYITPYNTVCEGYDPPLSISPEKAASFTVYPNPSNGLIKILSESTIETVSIRNISGQVLAQHNLSAVQKELQLDLNLSAGIYLISIESKGNREEQRIVIQ